MRREQIRRVLAVVAVGVVGVLIWSAWSTRRPEEPRVTRLLNDLRAGNGVTDNDSSRGKEGKKERVPGDSPIAGSKKSKRIRFHIPKERYLPIGRLQIPEIDLDVFFRDGVHEDILIEGPGHWPGTPLPGEAGNAVLSGHRTTYTHPFGGLDLLEPGDTVKTKLTGENLVRFEVTKNTVVPEAEYADFVLRQPKRPNVRSITMFACHPKGYRTYRIVVRAKATPAKPPR